MNESFRTGMVSENVDRRMAEVVAEITDRLQAGEPVDVAAYLARYPELADRLRPLLASLAVLDQFRSSVGSDRPPGGNAAELCGTLGDFRLIRQVGKGGMGVVYEAEQVSLGRRVALKVLPFAATMDARHLQRFQNEARAAACLHHTNIVPVFSVGCEQGVHFYAMQYIDGQPLSELIRQMRERENKTPTTARGEPTAAASTPLPAAEITPLTGGGRRDRDYFRKVAELGVQAAEALDHAHQLGIVHRDIKPANLLVDHRGNVWVTDFGLAQMQHSDASLTVTGQMLGTPRYMSPEQALAKRVPIDHRTDVYSLGATLYELLTLRPAFTSEDRQELLRQIAYEDPTRPCRLERTIPAELEIIVLKAMEKQPQDRFATAQEFGDDLRRWLLDQPIRARRPTAVQRLIKWGRRHRAVVRTAMAALLIVSIVSSACAAFVMVAYSAEREQREAARKSATDAKEAASAAEMYRQRSEANLRKAVEGWGQSFEYFSRSLSRSDTQELAAMRKRQIEKARRFFQQLLEEIGSNPNRRSEAALVQTELGRVYSAAEDFASAEKAFSRSISLYCLLIAESPEESPHRKALEDVYNSVAAIANVQALEAGGMLSQAARRRQGAEKYLWVARLYALVPVDWTPVPGKGASGHALQEPVNLYNAAKWLHATGGSPTEADGIASRAIISMEMVPARYPGKVWLALCWWQQAQARSLRGQIRFAAGRQQEAESDYQKALALFTQLKPEEIDTLTALPDLARLEQGYGELLWSQGNKQAASLAFQRAEEAWRRVKHPENARRHDELAWFLATCPDEHFRKPEEAVALSEKAVTLRPKDDRLWRTRGVALLRAGRHHEAAEALEKGVQLGGGGDALDWFFLAIARRKLDDKEKAREWFDRATGWTDKNQPHDPMLRRFRAEAATLLGIRDAPAMNTKEVSPQKP